MDLKFSGKTTAKTTAKRKHSTHKALRVVCVCVCLYSEVDENPDYDNLDIVSRDAEDKYFDEDDEEYDEEEETMTE